MGYSINAVSNVSYIVKFLQLYNVYESRISIVF